MKNKYIILSSAIIFGIGIILLISVGLQTLIYQKKQIYIIQDSAYDYLTEKYNREPIYLGNGNYYDSVFFYDAYFEEKDHFQVRYISASSSFEDDYLQNILVGELKKIINDRLVVLGYSDTEIYVRAMIGTPRDLTNRLYEYYKKLGREPRVQDIIGLEKFSHITVYFNKDVVSESEKERINNLLADLPIERIDYRVRE
ncbi:MAG: hypothetical protein IJF30_02530 [Clostridia bacterium]|nr:hypothetical protein [Clostridia bacterium]